MRRNYDEFYEDYYDEGYYKAMQKNYDLVELGEEMKYRMCGIGQRKVKLFLNSLVKKDDQIAAMYREILEAENSNINAKKYRNTISYRYKDDYYEKKSECIEKLVHLVVDYNNRHTTEEKIPFGWQKSNVADTDYIIYFDLPDCEQISFHTNLSNNLKSIIPNYSEKWDGKVNSTLPKIEAAISLRYKDELYSKYKEEIDKFNEMERKRKQLILERQQWLLEQQRQKELQKQKEQECLKKILLLIKDKTSWTELAKFQDDGIKIPAITNLISQQNQKIQDFYASELYNINSGKFNTEDSETKEKILEYLKLFKSMVTKFYAKEQNKKRFIREFKIRLFEDFMECVLTFNGGAIKDTGELKLYLHSNRFIIQGIENNKIVIFRELDTEHFKFKDCFKEIKGNKVRTIPGKQCFIESYK